MFGLQVLGIIGAITFVSVNQWKIKKIRKQYERLPSPTHYEMQRIFKDNSLTIDGSHDMELKMVSMKEGPFATVWKALDIETNKFIAIKIMKAMETDEGHFRNHFEVMKRLDTQFVVAIIGCGHIDTSVAIAMEFFELGSLQNVLQKDQLPSNARVAMLLELAKAMAYLHANGITHQNLKPANVLVCSTDPLVHPMCKFVSLILNVSKKV